METLYNENNGLAEWATQTLDRTRCGNVLSESLGVVEALDGLAQTGGYVTQPRIVRSKWFEFGGGNYQVLEYEADVHPNNGSSNALRVVIPEIVSLTDDLRTLDEREENDLLLEIGTFIFEKFGRWGLLACGAMAGLSYPSAGTQEREWFKKVMCAKPLSRFNVSEKQWNEAFKPQDLSSILCPQEHNRQLAVAARFQTLSKEDPKIWNDYRQSLEKVCITDWNLRVTLASAGEVAIRAGRYDERRRRLTDPTQYWGSCSAVPVACRVIVDNVERSVPLRWRADEVALRHETMVYSTAYEVERNTPSLIPNNPLGHIVATPFLIGVQETTLNDR